jgi:hypothetical protein
MRNVRSERIEGTAETQSLPEFAYFALSATSKNPALTRMGIDTSHDSHSSQVQGGNLNADLISYR